VEITLKPAAKRKPAKQPHAPERPEWHWREMLPCRAAPFHKPAVLNFHWIMCRSVTPLSFSSGPPAPDCFLIGVYHVKNK
jgi:hypothetical protein